MKGKSTWSPQLIYNKCYIGKRKFKKWFNIKQQQKEKVLRNLLNEVGKRLAQEKLKNIVERNLRRQMGRYPIIMDWKTKYC